MSLVFKLTIPDGALAQYLSSMSSKARNFEIVRLATNELLRMQHPQSQLNDGDVCEESKSHRTVSKPSMTDYSPSSNGIASDTKAFSAKEEPSQNSNDRELSISNRVDFGNELFDMN